jgi:hypothetical protein
MILLRRLTKQIVTEMLKQKPDEKLIARLRYYALRERGVKYPMLMENDNGEMQELSA